MPIRHFTLALCVMSFGLFSTRGANAAPAHSASKVVFVDANATPPGGIGDGTSWDSAYTSLALALALEPGPADFWVAEGTYKPVIFGDPRLGRFVIETDQFVFGGFAGNETERDQRSPDHHPVILSGETSFAPPADHTYNVVTIDASGSDAGLDGVTVLGGRDTRSSGADAGGIVIKGGHAELRQVRVTDNQGASGGGLHVSGGSVTMTRVLVDRNGAISAGTVYEGGLLASGGSVTIDHSVFVAGQYLDGTVATIAGANSVISTSIFSTGSYGLRFGNGTHHLGLVGFAATDVALEVSNGNAFVDGSLFSNNKTAFIFASGSLDVTNSTFVGNSAGFSAQASMVVRNSTLVGNGQGVSAVAPVMANDIIQAAADGLPTGSAPSVPPTLPVKIHHSIIDFDCAAAMDCSEVTRGNALLRPLVVTDGETTEFYPLFDGSPAIDAGEPDWCEDHDQRGIPRALDGNLDGTAVCDIGSYELDPLRLVFKDAASSAGEASGEATLDVVALGDIFNPRTIRYSRSGGTATPGQDFDFPPGEVDLDPNLCPGVTTPRGAQAPVAGAICAPPGNLNLPLTLTIALRDDFMVEPDETVEVTISPAENTPQGAPAGTAANSTHTLTIKDNEPRLKCAGVAATIVGSPGNDLIVGTDGRDVIVARGGNDRIRALAGNDRICGGPGDDTIRAAGGNDTAFGHGGEDLVNGGPGRDEIRGGGANDILNGGGGNDTLFGQRGDDSPKGNAGRDRLSGGPGAKDRCEGGPGTDALLPQAGCETVTGVP